MFLSIWSILQKEKSSKKNELYLATIFGYLHKVLEQTPRSIFQVLSQETWPLVYQGNYLFFTSHYFDG